MNKTFTWRLLTPGELTDVLSTPHNSTLLYIPRTSGYVDTGSMG